MYPPLHSARRLTLSLLVVATLLVSGSASAREIQSLPSTKTSAPLKVKNWGILNTTAKSHIQAVDAWKLESGKKDIVVAVIDTGLDANHKNLAKNVWKDPRSKTPVFGWNFVTNSPNPSDEHGHGTHVSGIIGAVADSESGVAGVAQNVSIMGVKYYSESNSGSVNLSNTVKAINYAIDNGARIINYSGGGPEFSNDEFVAIKRAESLGILFVAAAGNEQQNTDKPGNAYFPSAYGLSNIVSVAATDIRNNLLPTSNWGKRHVDVTAPGENIFSTLPKDKFGYMSGTSQATAFVSGLAALLLSKDPNLTPAQLKRIIRASVDRFPQLEAKIGTGGRINALNALVALRDHRQELLDNPATPLEMPGSSLADRFTAGAMPESVSSKTTSTKTTIAK